MKQATIRTKFDETYTPMYLDDLPSLTEYIEYESPKIGATLKSMIHSSRPDHVYGYAGSIIYHCVFWKGLGVIMGANDLDRLLESKYNHMAECIMEGGVILANDAGGYCRFEDGYHTLVSLDGEKSTMPESHYISPHAHVMNLENDPKLETYVTDKIQNLSHVTNLRLYNEKDLRAVLQLFYERGGRKIFQYTTGSDVDQMYEYTRCCLAEGIKEFEFHFNAGTTPAIEGFVDWLKSQQDVKVTCKL